MNDRVLRLAALKLYPLHAADRAWIIRRLEPATRTRIGALLKELHNLGIQRLPRVLDDTCFVTANIYLDPLLVRAIDNLDAESAFSMLESVPLRLKALVLHAYRWRWTSAVWLRLDEGERQRMTKAMREIWKVRPDTIVSVLTSFRQLARNRRDQRSSGIRA